MPPENYKLSSPNTLQFVAFKGCLAVKGSFVDSLVETWISRCCGESFQQCLKNRKIRDAKNHHITVISAAEMKQIHSVSNTNISAKSDLVSTLNHELENKITNHQPFVMHDLGIGHYENQVYYIIIYAPFLQKTRTKLGLPPFDFHITLGFHKCDVHNVRKDCSTLWLTGPKKEFIPKMECILRSKRSLVLRQYLKDSWLAEIASKEGYLFGVYYLAKYQSNIKVACDILEEAVSAGDKQSKCMRSSDTEIDYGVLVCQVLNNNVYSPMAYHHRLRRLYSSTINKTNKQCYEIRFSEMPRNFSFVSKNVAGSSLPDSREAMENFVTIGITDIITVMEQPLDNTAYSDLPLRFHWYKVKDRTPPSTDQMLQIMAICDKNERKILVHCLGGVGRTATVLAAHLMWSKGLSRQDALKPLLDHRRTILASSQTDFLTTWFAKCLTAREEHLNITGVAKPPSAQISPLRHGKKIKFPPLIMCMGYPASGKSSFATALCHSYNKKSQNHNFIRVNQDELGRKKCQDILSSHVKKTNTTIVLDRCHLTRSQRQEWLALAHHKKTWIVYFSAPAEECKWRIVRRIGHPTIKDGKGGRIIDTLAGTLEEPTLAEGFDNIFVVDTFTAANALLKNWGCHDSDLPVSTIIEDLPLFKFPRTRHLLNLGSATRDDLIISKSDASNYFLKRDVVVEEKIDGANMGLSIRNNKLCAQNRSHYVCSQYHPQFRYLDKWIHHHSAVLWDLLECSDRYILFGEWCYAKHSISYSALSDWFVAFDMYDRCENKFWSRDRLEAHLKGSGISLIPVIAKLSFPTLQSLQSLVHTMSRYYNGPVEGIVVRVPDEDNLFVEQRGKIVRSDFLSGNEFWTKHGCQPNTIAPIEE